jgi:CysZ protein
MTLYARTPRLLLLGLVPALATALIFAAALVVLISFLPDLTAGATWFAGDWSEQTRAVLRVLVGIALLGAAVLVGVITFTALTLVIGDPFYQRISRHVEQSCGGVTDEVETGFWRSLGRTLGDSARLLAVTVPLGLALFLAGFLPVVGQTVVPVLAALVGGWVLAAEMVGSTFERRGLRMRDRRRALRDDRAAALGFGTAVFVCFLIPGGIVLVMPAAVAGGTLLARRVLGLPHQPGADGDRISRS